MNNLTEIPLVFEYSTNITEDEVHEALCRAIHEGDLKALQVLRDNVTNITIGK